jgi:hypothetical protein
MEVWMFGRETFKGAQKRRRKLANHGSSNHALYRLLNNHVTLSTTTHIILARVQCRDEIAAAVTRTTLLAEVNTFLVAQMENSISLYKEETREVMALSDDDIRKGRNWSLFHKDGFAPGGDVENARNKEQRITEMVAKLRQYMNN